jgi:hypothetical protein
VPQDLLPITRLARRRKPSFLFRFIGIGSDQIYWTDARGKKPDLCRHAGRAEAADPTRGI